MADLVETPNGRCVVSPTNGEFTLCGDAFDLASHEPGYEWKSTRGRTVTCPGCAAIVVGVRGLRVA